MSRPKPRVLLDHTDQRWRKLEVITGQGLFVVTYRGQVVGVRTQDMLRNGPFKYARTTFVNAAHAYRLARRLNKLFHTEDFAVMWCRSGMPLTEDQYYEVFGVTPRSNEG